jgi:hypothetical protein
MISDNEAAGRLISIPGMVDTEATKPNRSLGVPRLVAYGFRTGLFDMVELKIANNPITQRTKKYRSLNAFFPNRIG